MATQSRPARRPYRTGNEALDAKIAEAGARPKRAAALQSARDQVAALMDAAPPVLRAAIAVLADPAAPGLGKQPRIGGVDHFLRRGLHRPRVGRGVVVAEEALDRGLARRGPGGAAADPVGEGHRDALQAEGRLDRDQGAVEVLVGRLAAGAAVLDRKSTRLNSSHTDISRMPSSA